MNYIKPRSIFMHLTHWAFIAFVAATSLFSSSSTQTKVNKAGRYDLESQGGLMPACVDTNGIFRYTKDTLPGCGYVIWPADKFPLKVYVSTSGMATDSEVYGTVIMSIAQWNATLGIEVFTMTIDKSEADVLALVGEPVIQPSVGGGRKLGQAQHVQLKRGMSAIVEVYGGVSIATMHKVLVHELGHVLGLAHDGDDDSIMYPVILDEKPVRIQEADVELIKGVYK